MRKSLYFFALLFCILSSCACAGVVPAQEYTADSHTTMLCHFNSSAEVTGLGGIVGANVQFVTGKFGSAAQFVQAGDYISFPTSGVVNQSQGTVEMFIKSTVDLDNLIYPNDAHPYFFHMYSNDYNRLALLYNVANKTIPVSVDAVSNGINYSAYPQAAVDWKAGVWHHVAFTWGNGAVLLYIDGELISVQDYPVGLGTIPARFYIGSTAWQGGHPCMVIDELRVSDICRDFQPGEYVEDDSTKLLCHVNSSGEVAGLGGTVSTNVQFVPGKFGSSAQFNAYGDRISFPTSGRINASQGTIEMYVQPTIDYGSLVYPTDPHPYFFHMYTSDSNWVGLLYNVCNRTLVATANNGGASAYSQAAVDWYPGDWHHVAFTWGDGSLKLYIDRQLAAQQSFTGGLGTLSANLYVGSVSWYSNQAHAAIDELRIYNTPLDFALPDYSVDINQIYFYSDELTSGTPVLPVIKIDTGCGGTLRLKITKNSTPATSVITNLGAIDDGLTEITIQPQQISGNGTYTVEALLTPATGVTLRDSTTFTVGPRPSWPSVSVSSVSIGTEGSILVNGSPYFPVEMYHATSEDYADMNYMGFNSVMGGWSSDPSALVQQLNTAQSSGLLMNVGLEAPGYGSVVDTYANLQAKVSAVRNHPALLFYNLVDEPNKSYYPTLAAGYDYVKSLDGNHLQSCTLPNFLGANLFSDEDMDDMALTRDIISPDIYPFDSCPVSWVPEGVSMCVDAAARAQSIKSVLYVGGCFEYMPWYRLPEPDEIRLIAYLAVIKGAKGLAWYSYREPGLESAGTGYGMHVAAAEKARSTFKQVNYELSQIYPAICAANPAQCFSASTNGTVQYVLKDDQGSYYYLITANQDKLPRTVTFSQSAGISDQQITVLSEDRTVSMANGSFVDQYEPYAVHIYKISKQ